MSDIREDFEKYIEAAGMGVGLSRDGDSYYSREIHNLWCCWRAALASRPAEVDDEGLPPIDCSGTPASCPDNEGYGCHCSQVAEAASVDRLSITKMVSESMTKHRVKYQPGMGGMIVDIMEKFGIPPSHTTNKEKD